ncbi:MAG: hypothetical protein QXP42_04825 [Candidatus Micrarchaeia archaeon]
MEELTFLDLVLLGMVDGSSVEELGGKINSSFFDGANIAGAMKIRGYVDIKPSYSGPSRIEITDKGKEVRRVADEESAKELDKLDFAVLNAISLGKIKPNEIEKEVNVRSGDVALSLYRLFKKGYVDYKIKNAEVMLSLTRKGFELAGQKEERMVPTTQAEAAEKDVEYIFGFKEPVKLNAWKMQKEKLVYYLNLWKKYLIIALVVIAIMLCVYISFRS